MIVSSACVNIKADSEKIRADQLWNSWSALMFFSFSESALKNVKAMKQRCSALITSGTSTRELLFHLTSCSNLDLRRNINSLDFNFPLEQFIRADFTKISPIFFAINDSNCVIGEWWSSGITSKEQRVIPPTVNVKWLIQIFHIEIFRFPPVDNFQWPWKEVWITCPLNASYQFTQMGTCVFGGAELAARWPQRILRKLSHKFVECWKVLIETTITTDTQYWFNVRFNKLHFK